jgi:hypothetical protein
MVFRKYKDHAGIHKSLISIFIGAVGFCSTSLFAQPVPAPEENIPYLITFGKAAGTSWGDDDFSQAFFFLIPENYKAPLYIRVYDPDVGGALDELNGVWDTQACYTIYGGKGCFTEPDAQETDPKGKYKSGVMLATKTFGVNPKYDKNWYTFGPFNPSEGEYYPEFKGNILKIICEGISGDDGNIYRYFMSTSPTENIPVEGGNAFAYEYTFRMWDSPNQVSHIYPYIDNKTISVKISNFDWDDDGYIRVVSVARNGQILKVSGDNNWATSELAIRPQEKNTSFDIQFVKKSNPPVKNNNVVINVRNQYNQTLKFFTSPIGGIPKYKYKINVRSK